MTHWFYFCYFCTSDMWWKEHTSIPALCSAGVHVHSAHLMDTLTSHPRRKANSGQFQCECKVLHSLCRVVILLWEPVHTNTPWGYADRPAHKSDHIGMWPNWTFISKASKERTERWQREERFISLWSAPASASVPFSEPALHFPLTPLRTVRGSCHKVILMHRS